MIICFYSLPGTSYNKDVNLPATAPAAKGNMARKRFPESTTTEGGLWRFLGLRLSKARV